MTDSSRPGARRATQRYVIAVLLTGVVVVAAVAIALVRQNQADAAARARLEGGPVDIGFAQAMSVHHQQAVAMAQMLLDGRPTPLETLARTIVYTQLLELGEMRGWLRLWQQPWLPQARDMDWMLLGDEPPDAELTQYLLDCQRAPAGMVGMATDAELAELRRLDGRARDELFLRLMLRHHEGGIPMARFAARFAQLAQVRALASNMVIEQSEEMRRMLLTLAAMDAAPPG